MLRIILLIACMLSQYAIALEPVTVEKNGREITITVDQGWYVYGANATDFGVPLRILADGVDITDQITLPPPVKVVEVVAGESLSSEVYREQFKFHVPNESYDKIEVVGGACNKQCIGFSKTFEAGGTSILLYILLMAFLGGLILNIMPCVLPVVSLKLAGLLKYRGLSENEARKQLLATTAGVMVSFWVLALIALGVKAAGDSIGWGFQFHNPKFVYLLALCMIIYAGVLWGDLRFELPQALSGKVSNYSSSFASGAFATLMATPCTAPFLTTALAYSLSHNAPQIFLIYSTIGLGLSSPFWLLAIFPAWIRFMPKSGNWMHYLEKFFAILLIAAACWLIYVLYGQLGMEATASIVGFLVLIKFALSLNYSWRMILAAFLIGLSLVLPFNLSNHNKFEATVLDAYWQPFNEEAIHQHLKAGRYVFVDITADWCITCKYNKFMVFNDRNFLSYLTNHNIVLMRGDLTRPDPKIASFLESHKRQGIPFNLLYSPKGEPVIFPEILTKQKVLQIIEEHLHNNKN